MSRTYVDLTISYTNQMIRVAFSKWSISGHVVFGTLAVRLYKQSHLLKNELVARKLSGNTGVATIGHPNTCAV